ncbi:SDR family oxidoreductase [Embleya sp. NPDC020886]|uniref:SDR family oxidoreductase n=1 Tax=Embleya sp. NPDC020886 TaxID=3363980 RepID=UPI00379AD9D8
MATPRDLSGGVAALDRRLPNTLRSTLTGWNKARAREAAPHGVTADVVLPGRTDTPRIPRLDASRAEREGISADAAARARIVSIPPGRCGDPPEYAAAVALSASSRAGCITGTALRVDGGSIPSV